MLLRTEFTVSGLQGGQYACHASRCRVIERSELLYEDAGGFAIVYIMMFGLNQHVLFIRQPNEQPSD